MKKQRTNNHLAEGEATGHCHCATGKKVAVWEDEQSPLEIEAPEGMEVTHQEHKVIEIPAGTYRSDKVLEFDPAEQEARQVRD
jgi:hypothetical protein